MKNTDKQYVIFIRSTGQRVSCSKLEFDAYYQGIGAFRRTQMNHGCCICPQSKWLNCDMDCFNCPYHVIRKCSSLDDNFTDSEGNELSWLERLQEELPDLQSPDIDDKASDELYLKEVIARLCELMPEAIEIGKLRLQGLSESAIAEEIGVGRKTFAYRLKKAEVTLKKEFPDFLW